MITDTALQLSTLEPHELATSLTVIELVELLEDLSAAIDAADVPLRKLKAMGGESMTGIGAEMFAQLNMAAGRYRHVKATIAALWRAKNAQTRTAQQVEASLGRENA